MKKVFFKKVITLIALYCFMSTICLIPLMSYSQSLTVKSKSLPSSTTQKQIIITFSQDILKGPNFDKITLLKKQKIKGTILSSGFI